MKMDKATTMGVLYDLTTFLEMPDRKYRPLVKPLVVCCANLHRGHFAVAAFNDFQSVSSHEPGYGMKYGDYKYTAECEIDSMTIRP